MALKIQWWSFQKQWSNSVSQKYLDMRVNSRQKKGFAILLVARHEPTYQWSTMWKRSYNSPCITITPNVQCQINKLVWINLDKKNQSERHKCTYATHLVYTIPRYVSTGLMQRRMNDHRQISKCDSNIVNWLFKYKLTFWDLFINFFDL